jgi:hypothetical protein
VADALAVRAGGTPEEQIRRVAAERLPARRSIEMKTRGFTAHLAAPRLLAAAFAAGIAVQAPGPALAAAAPRTAGAPAAAPKSAPAAASSDGQGFLYGRVATRDNHTFEGRLLWGEEEAFWGELFNSSKTERPYEDDIPRKYRFRRRPIEIFGIDIGLSHRVDSDRQFVARFGDIARIVPERGERATVTMKTGSRFRVRGGSNDLGATISVWTSTGEVRLDWDRIRAIDVRPAPAGLRVAEQRLYGTAHTAAGVFRGFVQWDQQENVASAKLDAETRDGKLSLEMGSLQAIEPRGRSARVRLRNGREMTLAGTNDVNSDNRGLFVEDDRFGRVLVTWQALRRLDFASPGGSGHPYGAYRHGAPLRGRVVATDGKSYAGRLVYDIDEGETWEMLNGSREGVEYSIPLALVTAIVPDGPTATRVRLRDGEELLLRETSDVTKDNAGLLVFIAGQEAPHYIPWGEVRRIELER